MALQNKWAGRVGLVPPCSTNHRQEQEEIRDMTVCEVCGNDYDKAFQVTIAGQTRTFDSFECAIHALAPTCAQCGVRVTGHGHEQAGRIFCCAHCAKQAGATEMRDRA